MSPAETSSERMAAGSPSKTKSRPPRSRKRRRSSFSERTRKANACSLKKALLSGSHCRGSKMNAGTTSSDARHARASPVLSASRRSRRKRKRLRSGTVPGRASEGVRRRRQNSGSSSRAAPKTMRLDKKIGAPEPRGGGRVTAQGTQKWSHGDSNPGPLACHASALPTELWPRK